MIEYQTIITNKGPVAPRWLIVFLYRLTLITGLIQFGSAVQIVLRVEFAPGITMSLFSVLPHVLLYYFIGRWSEYFPWHAPATYFSLVTLTFIFGLGAAAHFLCNFFIKFYQLDRIVFGIFFLLQTLVLFVNIIVVGLFSIAASLSDKSPHVTPIAHYDEQGVLVEEITKEEQEPPSSSINEDDKHPGS